MAHEDDARVYVRVLAKGAGLPPDDFKDGAAMAQMPEAGLSMHAADDLAEKLAKAGFRARIEHNAPVYHYAAHDRGRIVEATPAGPVGGSLLLQLVARAYDYGCSVHLDGGNFVFHRK